MQFKMARTPGKGGGDMKLQLRETNVLIPKMKMATCTQFQERKFAFEFALMHLSRMYRCLSYLHHVSVGRLGWK